AGAGTRPRPSSHAAPRAARTRPSRKAAAVSAGVTGASYATVRCRGRQPLDMSRAFRIEWDRRATIELDRLRAFDRPPVRRTVAALEDQATTETINRKPLRQPLSALPEATWAVRVGRHRVLYRVDGGTVRVLRVILKIG